MERRVSLGSGPDDPSIVDSRDRRTTTASNDGSDRQHSRLAQDSGGMDRGNNDPGTSTSTLSDDPPARYLILHPHSQSGTRAQGSSGLGSCPPSPRGGRRVANDPGPSRSASDDGRSSSDESDVSENRISHETNYWPNISNWLQTHQGPKPVVNCIICARKLTIPGLQSLGDDDDDDHWADNWEDHVILGCGHVYGDKCMRAWVLECLLQNDDPNGPGCPMCREHIYAAAGLSLGQNCPILGPAYPDVVDPGSSPVLDAARLAFDQEITQLLLSDLLRNETSFSIQVFSSYSDTPIYERYHTATGLGFNKSVGAETLYRIASISKLMTVYTMLTELSDKHWNDPIADYVPELATSGNTVDSAVWSEVTLGSLASHMGGISRDYALEDLSPLIPSGIPGLPALDESEIVQCGTAGLRPCTREGESSPITVPTQSPSLISAESIALIRQSYPISPTYHTPAYSNMAFQLLGYAAENITGKPFARLIEERLLSPLNLNRTFLSIPLNDSNAIVANGWTLEFGEEAPAGAYVSCSADLTKLGRSILNSTLLPAHTTRKWLKPVAHTANVSLSIGQPWEIHRIPVATYDTRVVDTYTKNGVIGEYLSFFAVSPDHGIGYSILAAGPSVAATYNYLERRMSEVWLAAVEQAGREQADAVFGGNYTHPDDSTLEISLYPGEPGLFLSKLVSNGTNLLAVVGTPLGSSVSGDLGAWLYPMRLTSDNRVAFRAVFGARGQPAERCGSWGALDIMRYGGYPVDLLVFELGADGMAEAVEVPILKKTLRKEVGSSRRRQSL
ncbi:Penicillin-binding protein 4 [Madurella mycetomatis]|uniref:Penicillin-binding protein 4 n=1 Tax=Madurella mycetomatis TaxID=100816 RepID=A0A175WF10_9PEZI|nr:Penicillin-binding protein 4 [Madurella mycetomatis]